MKINRYLKAVALLLVMAVSFSNTAVVFAQDTKEEDTDARLEGKVYDADQKTVLKSGTVRIVHSETGESREDDLNNKGNFCFEDLPTGNYSLTYIRTGAEFPLTEKFALAPKVKVATCLSLGAGNILLMMADKEADDCDCDKGLPIGFILLGGGAAIAAGVIIGGGEEPEASPSQP